MRSALFFSSVLVWSVSALALFPVTASVPAYAQEMGKSTKGDIGQADTSMDAPAPMHHLVVTEKISTKDKTPAKETAAPSADQETNASTKPGAKPDSKSDAKSDANLAAPKLTPLPIDKALVPPKDLKEWPHLSEAATAHTTADLKQLTATIEADRGAVPPQGLFLAAKALSDNGQMDDAALYFFAGQLRMMFDVSRWPARASKEQLAQILQNRQSNKSDDQKMPSGNQDPQIENPHEALSDLSQQIGTPIIKWVMADPSRLDNILKRVRIWDESAPYAYTPGYSLPEATPFEDWGRKLTLIRTTYFQRMQELASSLKGVKTP